MRVFNIAVSNSGLLACDALSIPTRSLVTLYGGTSNQRERIVYDLLLDESKRRLRALGLSCGRGTRRDLELKHKTRLCAEYDEMLPVFKIDQLIDKQVFVGDALGVGRDLIDLFTGRLCFRCAHCDTDLLDGSPETVFSDVIRLSKLEDEHVVPEAKLKCFFFARFDVAENVRDFDSEDRLKRAVHILRYALHNGYNRAAINNIDSKDALSHSVERLHKFSISDFQGSNLGEDVVGREWIIRHDLEELLHNVSSIDVLLDSFSFERLTKYRLQDDYKRLTDFGCAVGILSLGIERDKSRHASSIFRVGDFFYCPGCGALLSRQECDDSCLPLSLRDPSQDRLDKSHAYLGAYSLNVLFQMPFCQWLAWLNAIDVPPECMSAFNRLCEKLELLSSLSLGELTYSRLSGSLSSGEFFKLSLLALTHSVVIETLIVLEEPLRFISRDEYVSVLEQMKKLVRHGISLFVSEQNAQIAQHSDWVIELAGDTCLSWQGSLTPVYQGPPKLVEGKVVNSLLLRNMQDVYALERNHMLDIGLAHSVVMVCGESGSGKTVFLQNAVARAECGELKAVGGHRFSKGIYLSWEGGSNLNLKGPLIVDTLGVKDEVEKQCCSSVRVGACTIGEVYRKSISEVLSSFAFLRKLSGRLKPYVQIGLGHLSLGDAIRSLSRDELLRLRLVTVLWQLKDERILLALDQVFSGMEASTIDMCLKQIYRLGKARVGVIIVSNESFLMDIVGSAFDQNAHGMVFCRAAVG